MHKTLQIILYIPAVLLLGSKSFDEPREAKNQTNSKTLMATMNSTQYATTDTDHEILAVVKAWNDAFTRNDVETYFSYIHEDLTLFIPASPYRIDGKKDDKEEFIWSLNKSRTKVHFFQELQPQVQVHGNTAIVTYYNRGAYGPDGNEQISYLKETNVLVKENDKWQIIHIHVSK